MKINGVDVAETFLARSSGNRKIATMRLEGFRKGLYQDLIKYLFLEDRDGALILTLYLDVPQSASKIRQYQPNVEHWRLTIEM